MKILVINAGSSSLKYQLIDMETEHLLAKGLCERIGIDGHLKHTPLIGGKPVFDEDLPMPTHSEAIAAVIDKLTSAEPSIIEMKRYRIRILGTKDRILPTPPKTPSVIRSFREIGRASCRERV